MSPDLVTIATALGLYAAVVVSPGPNFALISHLALSGQRQRAGGAILSLAVAAIVYATLTMTGLGLLLVRVGWLASLIQMAGGCYLVYLGIATWRSGSPALPVQQQADGGATWPGFRTGLLVNLSNPKAITFFVGLYAVAITGSVARSGAG